MTTFFEHQRSSFKKNYIKNLITLASSDGILDDGEKELIFRIGKSRGLKEWQISALFEEEDKQEEFFLPETMANRMNLLYDFMQIVYADGTVNSNEIGFVKEIIVNFNLRPEIVDHLIDLFQYGTPTAEEWNEFVEYIKEVFIN